MKISDHRIREIIQEEILQYRESRLDANIISESSPILGWLLFKWGTNEINVKQMQEWSRSDASRGAACFLYKDGDVVGLATNSCFGYVSGAWLGKLKELIADRGPRLQAIKEFDEECYALRIKGLGLESHTPGAVTQSYIDNRRANLETGCAAETAGMGERGNCDDLAALDLYYTLDKSNPCVKAELLRRGDYNIPGEDARLSVAQLSLAHLRTPQEFAYKKITRKDMRNILYNRAQAYYRHYAAKALEQAKAQDREWTIQRYASPWSTPMVKDLLHVFNPKDGCVLSQFVSSGELCDPDTQDGLWGQDLGIWGTIGL